VNCHGFAMDRPWLIRNQSESCVELEMDGCDPSWPFPDCSLSARISLEADGSLRSSYLVVNNGKSLVPFSIGNHACFVFPFSGGSWDDGGFSTSAMELCELTERCLLSGASSALGPAASLTEAWVCNSVLRGPASAEGGPWAQLTQPGVGSVRVSHRIVDASHVRGQLDSLSREQFIVLWGSREDGFLCMEPWLGGPNSLNTGRGAVLLPVGGRFSWEWSAQVN
jgi:galactose mutarotase-like enzyme